MKALHAAWLAVLAAVAHVAALLFVQVRHPFPFLNDSVLHFGLIQSLASAHARGQTLLDPWVPSWNLGFPAFHYYQNLPHLLVLGFSQATGGALPLVVAFKIVEWLAVSTLPIPVFLAMRTFGFSPARAASAACLSLWVRTNYLHGMELESSTFQGLGQFTQAVGLWFFPLALAHAWTSITRGASRLRAPLYIALTMLCHLALGVMALMAAGLVALFGAPAGSSPLIRRLLRLGTAASAAIAVAAYSLVPVFRDFAYYNISALVPTWKYGSFGHQTILPWLVRGDLFDFGRVPVLTALVAAGLGTCVWRARRDAASRTLAACFLFFFLLFLGRPTWGRLLDLLPLGQGFHFSRVLVPVQLIGVMMAGVAVGAAVERVANMSRLGRFAIPASLALALGLAAPMLAERTRYLQRNVELVRGAAAEYAREGRDLERAVELAKGDRSGRVYAGLGRPGGHAWGGSFMVGLTPVYSWLPIREVDALGYLHHMWSLNADLHAKFDERNPDHYRVFNVNRILAPTTGPRVPGFAREIGRFGRFRVLEVETPGFIELVDAPYAINVSKRDLARVQARWLSSELPHAGVHPEIRLTEAMTPDSAGVFVSAYEFELPVFAPSAPAGEVLEVSRHGEDFDAKVRADRDCQLLLKMSFHPGWKAKVDGISVSPVHLCPSYLGVHLSPGVHQVELRYDPGSEKPILLVGGLLGFAALVCLGAWVDRVKPGTKPD